MATMHMKLFQSRSGLAGFDTNVVTVVVTVYEVKPLQHSIILTFRQDIQSFEYAVSVGAEGLKIWSTLDNCSTEILPKSQLRP